MNPSLTLTLTVIGAPHHDQAGWTAGGKREGGPGGDCEGAETREWVEGFAVGCGDVSGSEAEPTSSFRDPPEVEF